MVDSASAPHMEPTIGLRAVVFFGLAYMGPSSALGYLAL